MMETKLWIALCAILVIHLGSATPDNNGTADPLDPVPSSTNNSLRITETDPDSNATGSLNNNTSNTGIIVTPEPRKNNVTTIASDGTSTKTESITHSALSPSQSHPTTHITQTPSLNTSVTPTSSSNHNVSHPQNSSDKLAQSTALPARSAPTFEPSKPVSTTVTAINTTKSSTSSTSSSQNPTTSRLTTNSPQSSRQSTTAQPNGRDNPHTVQPLPLNMDNTTTVRDSPALDPLLAGLVSAFIIAAVIITLLLFLKLRRRGNGPEFRRLQDLPMDDMEDTPLAMYSY